MTLLLVVQAPSTRLEPTPGMSPSITSKRRSCCAVLEACAWPCLTSWWCCCRVEFVKEPYGPVAIDSAGQQWRGGL